MNDNVIYNIAYYSKRHRRRKIWLRILAFLCAVVVFVTTYALILPGITKERSLFCGFDEHTHTEECYKTVYIKELICTPELHEHNEECVNEEGEILCREADYFIHKHNELCYNDKGELLCPLPEIEEHTHSDDCYTLDENSGEKLLSCTKPPLTLHSHDEEECYSITETEDGEEKELICEKMLLTEHIHTNECLKITESKELNCSLTEHKHNEDCYIDSTSDVETPSVWEATLPKEQSGIWNKDLLLTARSQLGYSESKTNFIKDENGIKHGYTRYGEWYKEPYREWNELFVMFCLEYSGVDDEYFPIFDNADDWIRELSKSELLYDTTPKTGDLIFLEDNVGIISDVITDESGALSAVKAIARNEGGTVAYIECPVSVGNIRGYGNISKAFEVYEKTKPIEQNYSDEKVTVTAKYHASAEIPGDAVLSVTPIAKSNKKYTERYDEARIAIDKANGQVKEANITDFYLYDICLISKGEEIQPNSSVDIEITLNNTNTPKDSDISVVHFAKDGTELPELSKTELAENNLNVGFSVESFSDFAIVGSTSSVIDIVSMTKFTGNIQGTQTYAVARGSSALLGLITDGTGALSATELWNHSTDANVSMDKRAQQWYIAQVSGSYRMYTIADGVNYYLLLDNGRYELTTDIGTAAAFTYYYRTGTLRLSVNNQFLAPDSDGFVNPAQTDLTLYQAPTATNFEVVFDAAIGYPIYMSSSNHKYEGAQTKVVNTNNGKVTLPHNDPDSSDTANYIKINDSGTGDKNNLNNWYKLNGWYDVVNKVFYDSSMLGKEITVTCNTIFYPEYVSATYDIGIDNGKLVAEQPDTRDFINTYMFDYNEIFNVDKAICTSYYKSGTQYLTSWKVDTADDVALVFFDYITDWNNPYGNIGYMLDRNGVAINGITVNEEKTAGTRGNSVTFPGTITSGIVGGTGASNQNNPRLDALFTHDTIPGRVFLGEGDWLYQYDDNIGYYYYNSANNAAAYNQSQQRFYVYDYNLRIDNNGSLHDFTPYTYRDAPRGGEAMAKEKDNEINYWVGMQSEIEFYLPHDSGDPTNKSTHGDDLQLRFSGDDDVWIFIDGKLAVDLGGVHDVVYGEINFATDKIRLAHAPDSNNVAVNAAGAYTEMPGVEGDRAKGVTTTDIPFEVKGGQYHTVTIYYLERGSALSNCAIYFNISPFYELELVKRDAATGKGLQGAEFTIYEDPECTISALLYEHDDMGNIIPSDSTFVSDENGVAWVEGLSAGGTYYIKETKPPGHYPDMSMYIIVANLARPGESVTIALDSNGKEFVYAEEYVFSAEHDHRVEIKIYNDMFVGGDKEIYVQKKWGEGSSPEPVILQLYANGEATERFVELNDECNWEATLYKLPEYDSEGREIAYSFKEVSGPPGYGVTYEETQEKESVTYEPGYWTAANSLKDGVTYRISHSAGPITAKTGDASLAPSSNGESDISTHWTAIEVNGKFALRNDLDGARYLYFSDQYAWVTDNYNSSNNLITYSGNKLSAVVNNRTYYLIGYNNGYGTTTTQRNGTNFTLQEWVPPKEIITIESKPGWLVTNTPWPETVSIPVTKIWDATVLHPPDEIVLELYLVTEGNEASPELVKSLTLNADSSWKGSFNDLPYPDTGQYYAVIEVTADYLPKYKNDTVSIFVNDKYSQAARVVYDTDGASVTVTIENTELLTLPDTGGLGNYLYTIGGAVLIASASALLLYKKRKRRQEGNFSP
ncbi:MAG: Cna B-type domain-containing protein [Ruminococcaceae bacterium]|nr:Cna B-type domain-containing protein [Oscillospiraceae bacterium]